MSLSGKDVRYFVAIVGIVWVSAFLLVGWSFRQTDPTEPLWIPAGNQEIKTGHPVPLIQDIQHTPQFVHDTRLRLAVKAGHFGARGGSIKCGFATLKVPQNATEAGGYFVLENTSKAALGVKFSCTARDLALAPTLAISYEGTQYGKEGLDPSCLQIFREITLGVFERIPSRVDLDSHFVMAEVSVPGRYVVG